MVKWMRYFLHDSSLLLIHQISHIEQILQNTFLILLVPADISEGLLKYIQTGKKVVSMRKNNTACFSFNESRNFFALNVSMSVIFLDCHRCSSFFMQRDKTMARKFSLPKLFLDVIIFSCISTTTQVMSLSYSLKIYTTCVGIFVSTWEKYERAPRPHGSFLWFQKPMKTYHCARKPQSSTHPHGQHTLILV